MPTRNHIVILLHGIRTRAEHSQWLAAQLEAADPEIRVRPVQYEFLDIVRFLVPLRWVRARPIERVERIWRDELTKGESRVSIVAHSFGTYIVGELLKNQPDLEIHRLILCGSILPDDFTWEVFRHRIGVGVSEDWQVINDCGWRDIWPVLAKSVTWGYGASGRFGFGHGRVKDRFHSIGHSGFFEPEFVARFWIPYLQAGEVIEGDLYRPPTSWWVNVLTVVKLRYLVLAVVLGSVALGLRGLTDPSRPADAEEASVPQTPAIKPADQLPPTASELMSKAIEAGLPIPSMRATADDEVAVEVRVRSATVIPYTVSLNGKVIIRSVISRTEEIGRLQPGRHVIAWALSQVTKEWEHVVSIRVGNQWTVVDRGSEFARDSENAVGFAVIEVATH